MTPEFKEFSRLAQSATLVPVVKSVSADLLTPVSAFLSIAKDEPLKLELQSFVNCVREKQTPVVSGESAKRALDLAFEITRQIQQIK